MANTPTRTYAPRIPRDEAERLIVEAAIDLLRESRFNEVSSRKIAEKAGVHAPTIARYFGSMNGLFAVVAKELARRDLTQLSARVDELADNSNLLLRSRLVAWCLLNGANPDDFMTSRETPAGRGLLARQSDFAGVSDRTTAAITEIYRFAFEGFAIMGQTHRFTAEQFADTMMLMQEIRRHLPEVEKALGWDEA